MRHTRLSLALMVFATILTMPPTYARDEKLHLPIDAALKVEGHTNLDPSIKLFFGNQEYPQTQKIFGSFITNKKTNAFGKSDETACNWAFLSAVLELQERARKEGGNAVVNIKSYYKKNEFKSNIEFECGAGAIISGVALQGDVVTLQ